MLTLVWILWRLSTVWGIIPVEDLLPFLNDVGERCRAADGSPGQCGSLALCPRALLAIKVGKLPNVCHFDGIRPLICCPERRKGPSPTGPSTKDCGRRTKPGSRLLFGKPDWQSHFVVGGKISEEPWPWMVAIFLKNFGVETFLCGGSVIGSHIVLTAAHCFGDKIEKSKVSRYVIRAGSSIDYEGRAYKAAKILLHPEYNSSAHYNDLALIKLEEGILSEEVQPVCLPSESLNEEALKQANVTVLGWGDQSYGGIRSTRLREVDIKVLSRKACNESYWKLGSSRISRGITDQFICAGVPEGGKDACQADSGGPLLLSSEDGWSVIGVVSFGYKCGKAEFPGVYTKVTSYLQWIVENAAGM